MLGKPENPSLSWFSDLVDVTMTPQTTIIYNWRHRGTPSNPRNRPESFQKNIFRNHRHIGTPYFWKLWKKVGAEKPEDAFNKFSGMLDMGSICIIIRNARNTKKETVLIGNLNF